MLQMSANLDSDDISTMSIQESYKPQVLIKSIQFIGLFYAVYGVFVAFANVCLNLDKKSFHNDQLFLFWDPVASIYATANFSVFGMTIYYKYFNYRHGISKLFSLPVDHMIVFFILIPLFFLSSIDLIIEVIRDVVIIPCHGNLGFLVPLSTLALFLGAIILVFDVGQDTSVNEDWKRNLLKVNVIFFTVIGIANYFIINFSFQHMLIFRTESLNTTYKDKLTPNETCLNDTYFRKSINFAYISCDEYLRSAILLFCICTFAYLIQPMIQRQKAIEINKMQLFSVHSENSELNELTYSQENESINIVHYLPVSSDQVKLVNDQQTPSFRLPSAALVLCIIFLSLSFLSFIIMLSLNSNEKHLKITGGLIFTAFPILVYVLGSGLTIVHIKAVEEWPIFLDRHGKVIEKCLIWIGAAGQVSISMATVATSIELLYNPPINGSIYTARNVMLIPNNILIVLQTFLQTILISMAIDREWTRPPINSWAELLCPAVGMMGFNIGLLLLNISDMNIPIIYENTNSLFLELFLNGLRSVGGTLSTLQRLHASIFFASMIVYTHN